MFMVTLGDMNIIAAFLEGFLYGLYSGVFAMYSRCQGPKKSTNKFETQNIISYMIYVLYILSGAVFICDIAPLICFFLGKPPGSLLPIFYIQMTLFGCCDLIAQFILIYRCWIVWVRNIRVVIIPSILAFAFLATWLVGGSSVYMISDEIVAPDWGNSMIMSGLALSLTVNALVTGLIVFRIFKVFQQVKASSEDKFLLAATGGRKLWRTILVLIESGMVLFSVQLARFVITMMQTDGSFKALNTINGIHNMLTGITPTIILVRTRMGLSFQDEKSMEEVTAIGSLRFASDHPDSVPSESGSIIDIVGQDSGDDDIGIRLSNEIDVVER